MFLSPKLFLNKSFLLNYYYGVNRSFIFLQIINNLNSQNYVIKLSHLFLNLMQKDAKRFFFFSNF